VKVGGYSDALLLTRLDAAVEQPLALGRLGSDLPGQAVHAAQDEKEQPGRPGHDDGDVDWVAAQGFDR
jgi:hypothetical protein